MRTDCMWASYTLPYCYGAHLAVENQAITVCPGTNSVEWEVDWCVLWKYKGIYIMKIEVRLKYREKKNKVQINDARTNLKACQMEMLL